MSTFVVELCVTHIHDQHILLTIYIYVRIYLYIHVRIYVYVYTHVMNTFDVQEASLRDPRMMHTCQTVHVIYCSTKHSGMCVCVCVGVRLCASVCAYTHIYIGKTWYGVATISRLLKIIGLFCKIAL